MLSKVDRTVDFQDFHPTTVDFSKKKSLNSRFMTKSRQSTFGHKSTVAGFFFEQSTVVG